MQKLVNVEAINVRSEARVEPDTLIGPIFLGQAVDDLEDGPEGWIHVRTAVDGKSTEGFVKAALPITKFDWQPPEQPTLRDPASPAREALVAAAVEQWLRFDRGAGKEAKEPFSGFIGEMWKAFGKPFTGKTATQPWSAVAISLMVRTAAREFDEYKSFQQSIGHAAYMWDAIKKNASGDLAAPFWGCGSTRQSPRRATSSQAGARSRRATTTTSMHRTIPSCRAIATSSWPSGRRSHGRSAGTCRTRCSQRAIS